MVSWLRRPGGDVAGDPGRIHLEGRTSRVAIEEARQHVADLVGTRPRQVVFTSGATEAVNAAVWGAARARPGRPVVLADVEHSCVREASARAAPVRHLAVDGVGRIDLHALEDALGDDDAGGPALVHCQAANHEVGTVQPVDEVVDACHRAGAWVHVDAAAAVGHVPFAFDDLGADLASVSAHKLGGPPGAGALLVRRGLRLDPLIVGGEQERARRAGLENTVAIVGFGAAAAVLADPARWKAEADTARRLSAALARAAVAVPGVRVVGDPDRRLPQTTCVVVDGVEAEPVLLGLDQAGIAAHSGSSCSSEALAPSPVLAAMGVDAERSLRLSVGWSNTGDDVSAFASAFPAVLAALRSLRP